MVTVGLEANGDAPDIVAEFPQPRIKGKATMIFLSILLLIMMVMSSLVVLAACVAAAKANSYEEERLGVNALLVEASDFATGQQIPAQRQLGRQRRLDITKPSLTH